MIRDTSIESYKQVVESGHLSERLIRTFDIIFRYGPTTSREANTYSVLNHGTDNNLNQFRSYLSQLQDLGVIETVDKVKCLDTSKTVYRFDVTGRGPVKVKRITKADKKRDMLATLDSLQPWIYAMGLTEFKLLKQQISNL